MKQYIIKTQDDTYIEHIEILKCEEKPTGKVVLVCGFAVEDALVFTKDYLAKAIAKTCKGKVEVVE